MFLIRWLVIGMGDAKGIRIGVGVGVVDKTGGGENLALY